jgi:PIN domain nuclease of toxin-antitoxin system
VARAGKSRLVFLDTHVVCWLYEGRVELLSDAAARSIESGRLLVSPVVDLELQYLHEIGRISRGPQPILAALAQELGMAVGEEPFDQITAKARELRWTRDPFDRLMVAQATLAKAQLVTKDRSIRRHFPGAVW